MGHGTVLAGRYRLEERVRTSPDGSVWRAVDETLERQVSVRMMQPGHPFAPEIVDAARRAALVEDIRLVRIYNVGEEPLGVFIVSEQLAGRTLAEHVAQGPLPADVVRRFVGEAAQALDRASARGLHHLRLLPETVVLSPEGDVTLIGTAVDAAVAGIDPDDAARASRLDTIGLVGLLYSGLTGRWPGAPGSDVPPAPRPAGLPVPPGDLVAGVPGDLDALCAVTLGPNDDGPRSPRELALQLAPWSGASTISVRHRVDPPAAPTPRSVEEFAPVAVAMPVTPDIGTREHDEVTVAGTDLTVTLDGADGLGLRKTTAGGAVPEPADSPRGAPVQGGPPPSSMPTIRVAEPWVAVEGAPAAAALSVGIGAGSRLLTAAVPEADDRQSPPGRPAPGLQPISPEAPQESQEPQASGTRADANPSRRRDLPPAGEPAASPWPVGDPPGRADGGRAAAKAGEPEPLAGLLAGPERVQSHPLLDRSAVEASSQPWHPEQWARRRSPVREQAPAEDGSPQDSAGHERTGNRRPRADRSGPPSAPTLLPSVADAWATWSGATPVDRPEAEPITVFTAQGAVGRPPRGQSRVVIALLAAMVAVVLIFAVLELRNMLSPMVSGAGSLVTSRPGVTSTGPAPRSVAARTLARPRPRIPSVAGGSEKIYSAMPLDPFGDGVESNATADRAVDGDPSTAWMSDYYATTTFGGLKKGLGLALDLGPNPSPVHSVTIAIAGAGGALELRTADQESFAGSTVIATGTTTGVPLGVTLRPPARSRYLILWFTRLPQVDSKWQLVISEITVR